ncbi:DUF58 domain-containing protein [Algirhabdus cladophorae]|uniref:DUF58 domain-containing protein n=1 Tax=Algirhabdus cladophorae TaxID=3377108 RepID=UPI003B8472E5
MSQNAPSLRPQAEALAAPFPALLAGAQHLANTIMVGTHGRRRAGGGEEFWQYRPVTDGDEARFIDWRRSARGDTNFVRQTEWQIAQSVFIWVDDAASLTFSSSKDLPSKSHRARTVALASAILLLKAGERVGLTDASAPPKTGQVQLMRLAQRLSDMGTGADYGAPKAGGMMPNARAIFISDFLGDMQAVTRAVGQAADRGVQGVLMQVLDPQEETFPFSGRTVFESMGKSLSHETQQAGDLRQRYLDRLAARKSELQGLARASGWQFQTHHTDASARSALLWLYSALERT